MTSLGEMVGRWVEAMRRVCSSSMPSPFLAEMAMVCVPSGRVMLLKTSGETFERSALLSTAMSCLPSRRGRIWGARREI